MVFAHITASLLVYFSFGFRSDDESSSSRNVSTFAGQLSVVWPLDESRQGLETAVVVASPALGVESTGCHLPDRMAIGVTVGPSRWLAGDAAAAPVANSSLAVFAAATDGSGTFVRVLRNLTGAAVGSMESRGDENSRRHLKLVWRHVGLAPVASNGGSDFDWLLSAPAVTSCFVSETGTVVIADSSGAGPPVVVDLVTGTVGNLFSQAGQPPLDRVSAVFCADTTEAWNSVVRGVGAPSPVGRLVAVDGVAGTAARQSADGTWLVADFPLATDHGEVLVSVKPLFATRSCFVGLTSLERVAVVCPRGASAAAPPLSSWHQLETTARGSNGTSTNDTAAAGANDTVSSGFLLVSAGGDRVLAGGPSLWASDDGGTSFYELTPLCLSNNGDGGCPDRLELVGGAMGPGDVAHVAVWSRTGRAWIWRVGSRYCAEIPLPPSLVAESAFTMDALGALLATGIARPGPNGRSPVVAVPYVSLLAAARYGATAVLSGLGNVVGARDGALAVAYGSAVEARQAATGPRGSGELFVDWSGGANTVEGSGRAQASTVVSPGSAFQVVIEFDDGSAVVPDGDSADFVLTIAGPFGGTNTSLASLPPLSIAGTGSALTGCLSGRLLRLDEASGVGLPSANLVLLKVVDLAGPTEANVEAVGAEWSAVLSDQALAAQLNGSHWRLLAASPLSPIAPDRLCLPFGASLVLTPAGNGSCAVVFGLNGTGDAFSPGFVPGMAIPSHGAVITSVAVGGAEACAAPVVNASWEHVSGVAGFFPRGSLLQPAARPAAHFGLNPCAVGRLAVEPDPGPGGEISLDVGHRIDLKASLVGAGGEPSVGLSLGPQSSSVRLDGFAVGPGNAAAYAWNRAGKRPADTWLEATLSEHGATGFTFAHLRASPGSLVCPSPVAAPVSRSESIRLVTACPLIAESLAIDWSVLGSAPLPVTHLPTNYRPPSNGRVAVPTSKYIYNGDPSQPRHRNRFPVSQATGEYQACAGAADRLGCACDGLASDALSLALADCVTAVRTAVFARVFVPRLVGGGGGGDVADDYSLLLVEVNNRTDFCLNATDVCEPVPPGTAVELRPGWSDGIVWRGSELFHFRVELAGSTHCAGRTTEFAVWVTGQPVTVARLWAAIGITLVGCALVLWCVYIGLYAR